MICSYSQSLSLEASWALGSFLEGWIWLVPWSASWTFWFHPVASPWRCQPHHCWPGRTQSTAWKRMSDREKEWERQRSQVFFCFHLTLLIPQYGEIFEMREWLSRSMSMFFHQKMCRIHSNKRVVKMSCTNNIWNWRNSRILQCEQKLFDYTVLLSQGQAVASN